MDGALLGGVGGAASPPRETKSSTDLASKIRALVGARLKTSLSVSTARLLLEETEDEVLAGEEVAEDRTDPMLLEMASPKLLANGIFFLMMGLKESYGGEAGS